MRSYLRHPKKTKETTTMMMMRRQRQQLAMTLQLLCCSSSLCFLAPHFTRRYSLTASAFSSASFRHCSPSSRRRGSNRHRGRFLQSSTSSESTTTPSSADSEQPEALPIDLPVAEYYRMDNIVNLCKRRGLIFPSSEIYGGYAGFYDYGPLGVALKQNVKELWWRTFVSRREDVVGLDSSIIHHPAVWHASGTYYSIYAIMISIAYYYY
jgi:hypothetical protein